MDINYIVYMLVYGVVIVVLIAAIYLHNYNRWIRRRELVKKFPAWKVTSKPKMWWLIWSSINWVTLPLYEIVALFGNTPQYLNGAFCFTMVPYFLIYQAIYYNVYVTFKRRYDERAKNQE